MHWNTFKQDNYSIVGGHWGCRVGKVQAGTTSPVPDHKGFEIHPLHLQVLDFRKFSTLRVTTNGCGMFVCLKNLRWQALMLRQACMWKFCIPPCVGMLYNTDYVEWSCAAGAGRS